MEIEVMKNTMPENLDLYGNGILKQSSQLRALDHLQILEHFDCNGKIGIAYKIFTLESLVDQVIVILLTEDGQDIDFYQEVGNIISSQIANRLAKDDTCLTTPPKILTSKQVNRVITSQKNVFICEYLHQAGSKTIRLDAVIIPLDSDTHGEIGHA